ncbi:MAG: 30S ribosomal protein S3 [Cytophagales bacterium]|nr:30S ribosomal protein S3 [Cytophagales bacterium]
MGNKVTPVGFRIGFTKEWKSCWWAKDGLYRTLFLEGYKIKRIIKEELDVFNIEDVLIERALEIINIFIYCPDPGIVIGKDGERINELDSLLNSIFKKKMRINVCKVHNKNLSAPSIMAFIRDKIDERVSYKRAVKQAMNVAMESHAEGIKVIISGRIGGAEIARSEKFTQGKIPAHTLRANIDFCSGVVETVYGTLGLKVWVYKGEVYKNSQPLLTIPQEPTRKNEKKNVREKYYPKR